MNNETLAEEARKLSAELQLITQSLERDLENNLTKNNAAAGRRVRASLRNLKAKTTELIRTLVKFSKEKK